MAMLRAIFVACLLALSSAASSSPKDVAWLVENAKAPGVVTLPSGLQYKVIKEGTGKKPLVSTPCR